MPGKGTSVAVWTELVRTQDGADERTSLDVRRLVVTGSLLLVPLPARFSGFQRGNDAGHRDTEGTVNHCHRVMRKWNKNEIPRPREKR